MRKIHVIALAGFLFVLAGGGSPRARADAEAPELGLPALPFTLPADALLATDDDPLGFVPSVSLGASGMLSGSIDRSGEQSRSVIGPAFFGVLAYNTGFFLRPFMELGYLSLYSSRMDTVLGPANASTSALSLVFGPSYRRFGLRVRGGLGASQLRVRSNFNGTQISAGELELTEYLAISGKIYAFDKFWVWLEGRSHYVLGAGSVVTSLSLTFDYGGWLKPR